MKITLYIPCYNAEEYIDGVLKAAFNQTLPADEVIVVDDGSTDNTVKIASRYPVRLIRHPENRGLSASRNSAIKSSKADFVAS
jgi:glycosyltransferase involved in cell wall biosynthesis